VEQKKGIRYTNKILDEVYQETPFSKKEVDEAWRIHLEYLKSLMDDPDVLRIDLPFLGVLYFSTYKSRAIIKRSRGSKKLLKTEDKQKKVEDEVKNHREFVKEKGYITRYIYPQIRKGGLYKLLKNIRLMLSIKKGTSYASNKVLFKTIEGYSNKRLKKDE